jgi:hypothetical protein
MHSASGRVKAKNTLSRLDKEIRKRRISTHIYNGYGRKKTPYGELVAGFLAEYESAVKAKADND